MEIFIRRHAITELGSKLKHVVWPPPLSQYRCLQQHSLKWSKYYLKLKAVLQHIVISIIRVTWWSWCFTPSQPQRVMIKVKQNKLLTQVKFCTSLFWTHFTQVMTMTSMSMTGDVCEKMKLNEPGQLKDWRNPGDSKQWVQTEKKQKPAKKQEF